MRRQLAGHLAASIADMDDIALLKVQASETLEDARREIAAWLCHMRSQALETAVRIFN